MKGKYKLSPFREWCRANRSHIVIGLCGLLGILIIGLFFGGSSVYAASGVGSGGSGGSGGGGDCTQNPGCSGGGYRWHVVGNGHPTTGSADSNAWTNYWTTSFSPPDYSPCGINCQKAFNSGVSQSDWTGIKQICSNSAYIWYRTTYGFGSEYQLVGGSGFSQSSASITSDLNTFSPPEWAGHQSYSYYTNGIAKQLAIIGGSYTYIICSGVMPQPPTITLSCNPDGSGTVKSNVPVSPSGATYVNATLEPSGPGLGVKRADTLASPHTVTWTVSAAYAKSTWVVDIFARYFSSPIWTPDPVVKGGHAACPQNHLPTAPTFTRSCTTDAKGYAVYTFNGTFGDQDAPSGATPNGEIQDAQGTVHGHIDGASPATWIFKSPADSSSIAGSDSYAITAADWPIWIAVQDYPSNNWVRVKSVTRPDCHPVGKLTVTPTWDTTYPTTCIKYNVTMQFSDPDSSVNYAYLRYNTTPTSTSDLSSTGRLFYRNTGTTATPKTPGTNNFTYTWGTHTWTSGSKIYLRVYDNFGTAADNWQDPNGGPIYVSQPGPPAGVNPCGAPVGGIPGCGVAQGLPKNYVLGDAPLSIRVAGAPKGVSPIPPPTNFSNVTIKNISNGTTVYGPASLPIDGSVPEPAPDGDYWSTQIPLTITQPGTYEIDWNWSTVPSPPPCNQQFNAGYGSYFSVDGGDIEAGTTIASPTQACSGTIGADSTADIKTWIDNSSYTGGGAGLGALAGGDIKYFPTGKVYSKAGNPVIPWSLAFANSPTGSYSGPTYGGNFDALPCEPDYYTNAKQAADPTLSSPITDFKTFPADNTMHTYDLTGDLTIDSTTKLAEKQQTTLRVNGNVYIDSNIAYDPYTTLATIPRLNLYVTGNIFVAPSVTELHGLYVAQTDDNLSSPNISGVFASCYDSTKPPGPLTSVTSPEITEYDKCNQGTLTVYGAIIADAIHFDRSYGSVFPVGAIPASPAEQIIYTPELWLSGYTSCVTNPAGKGCGADETFNGLPPVL